MSTLVEPLVRRNIFSSEDEAIKELVREYVMRQVNELQKEVRQMEHKYGLNFQQFEKFLHERSVLLASDELSTEQRQSLNRSVMQEEDDW